MSNEKPIPAADELTADELDAVSGGISLPTPPSAPSPGVPSQPSSVPTPSNPSTPSGPSGFGPSTPTGIGRPTRRR